MKIPIPPCSHPKRRALRVRTYIRQGGAHGKFIGVGWMCRECGMYQNVYHFRVQTLALAANEVKIFNEDLTAIKKNKPGRRGNQFGNPRIHTRGYQRRIPLQKYWCGV